MKEHIKEKFHSNKNSFYGLQFLVFRLQNGFDEEYWISPIQWYYFFGKIVASLVLVIRFLMGILVSMR